MSRDEAGKNGVELREFAQQQADMIAKLDQIDSTTKRFSTDVIGLIDRWPKSNKSETDDMVRYVLSDKWKAGEYAKRTVLNQGRVADGPNLDHLCKSLYFESISHREQSIPKRYAATFEWVFQEPRISDSGKPLWSNFPGWLQEDSGEIYWITGKPGSGKSTLIKFISQDPRFETLLQDWAAGSQLLIARFFSWIAGANKLQKTHEGLYRTILLEVIRQRAQMAVDIFPARWFLLQSFNGNINLPDLTLSELIAGFQNLLSATGKDLKLVLLIDGLDEFDDESDKDYRQLIQLLQETSKMTSIKICASSRPWNVFKDAYRNNPMLQLESLTRDDIESFVQERLKSSPGYQDFAATNQEALRKITGDLVDKSQGVFLWVSVISGLLEAGFQEGTSVSDLQELVNNLPTKIADLFRFIWDRTGKRFRAEAAQFFQIMNTSQKEGFSLYAFSVWFGSKDIPVDLDKSEVTEVYLTGALNLLERKLMSRTGGLLELTGNTSESEVRFMHRTAYDWVRENWASITSATDPDFNPYVWITKGSCLGSLSYPRPLRRCEITSLVVWQDFFVLASQIPGEHPDGAIVAAALRRLNAALFDLFQDQASWADKIPGYLDIGSGALSSLERSAFCATRPALRSCTDLLELAVRYPIPVFVKNMFPEEPSGPSSPTLAQYLGAINDVAFGEILFPAVEVRLDLLRFLTAEKFRPWIPQLEETTVLAEEMRAALSIREKPGIAYLTLVIELLQSRMAEASDLEPAGNHGVGVTPSIAVSESATASQSQKDAHKKPGRKSDFFMSVKKRFSRTR